MKMDRTANAVASLANVLKVSTGTLMIAAASAKNKLAQLTDTGTPVLVNASANTQTILAYKANTGTNTVVSAYAAQKTVQTLHQDFQDIGTHTPAHANAHIQPQMKLQTTRMNSLTLSNAFGWPFHNPAHQANTGASTKKVACTSTRIASSPTPGTSILANVNVILKMKVQRLPIRK